MAQAVNVRKVTLPENDIPRVWYNVKADLPSVPPPPLNPGTGQPIGPEDLAPIFPMGLILQEVSMEREVEIPEPIREIYKLWRPTPLHYASALKAYLDTPAHILYKYEGVSPPGSHKPNTAVAQAFYNRQEGVRRIATETGAGQWGSALSFACKLFDLECKVYMVRVSYEQKPYRRVLMQSYDATIVPSPSPDTEPGRQMLAQDPNMPGSLGIAISEAVWDAATRDDTKYSLGSVLDHVILHQTIVGLETRKQLELLGLAPDVLIGCVGGGSNFGGLVMPFVKDKLENPSGLKILAIEPEACPTLTRGLYAYDFGDTGHLTPLVKMFTLGSTFMPEPIHAGGLRYHGMAPLISHLVKTGVVEPRAYHQTAVFQAALAFTQTEGIIPAPESAHAVKAAIDEALQAKEEGQERVIVLNLSGHGYFDLSAYDSYLGGKLVDYAYPEEKIQASLSELPSLPNA